MNKSETLQKLIASKNPSNQALSDLVNVFLAKTTSEMDKVKGDKGEPGYTPLKGKDYFTEKEINTIAEYIQSKVKNGKDGPIGPEGPRGLVGETPKYGIDYWTEKDQVKILKDVLAQIPKPKDGVTPDVKDLVEKVKGAMPPVNFKDEIGKILATPGFRMLLHGGGISNITGLLSPGTNISLTGTGVSGDPYVINSTGGTSSPLTTKGDLYTFSTLNARLGVGTNGQILSADSTAPTGLKWITAPGGGDMLIATYDPAGVSEQLVGLTATQNITGKTYNKLTITQPATGSTLTIDNGFTLHVTGNVTAFSGSSTGSNTGDQTSVSGNAGTATALATTRTIGTITGDGTSTGSSFDGSANNTNALTLATVNSNVGSFGSATQSVQFTVNGKGLITAAANVTVTPAVGSITGLGTGVATFLATPSSANLISAVTDETGSGALMFGTSPTVTTSLIMADAANIVINATTGTKIGTATTQKLAFFNSTPIVQPTGDVVTALQNLGLIASATISATAITVGSTTIGSGTTTRILYNNAGTLGEYTITGTGTVVAMQTSPSFVTPALGVASYTTLSGGNITDSALTANRVTFAGTSGILKDDASLTIDVNSGLSRTRLFIGTATGISGQLQLGGSTSGSTLLQPSATASGTLTLPAATDTLVGRATTDTLTNKSIVASQITTGTFGTGAYTMDTSLTVPQEFNTTNAQTASANAITFTRANRQNKVTNNSAAGLTITLSTTSAVDGDMIMVTSLASSAVAQTITWVNTENSDITPSANLNASTTLPRTDGFRFNGATSKWRCIGSC